MFELGTRSVMKVGKSRGITIPSDWLKNMKPVAVKVTLDDENRLILTAIPAESDKQTKE